MAQTVRVVRANRIDGSTPAWRYYTRDMRSAMRTVLVEVGETLPKTKEDLMSRTFDRMRESQAENIIDVITKMEWLKNAINGVYTNLEAPMGFDQVEQSIEELRRSELTEFMQSLAHVREQLESAP